MVTIQARRIICVFQTGFQYCRFLDNLWSYNNCIIPEENVQESVMNQLKIENKSGG